MTVDLLKKANEVAQSAYVSLTNAITDASAGIDYGYNWEQAQRYQMELLRLINEIKYKQTKPRGLTKTPFHEIEPLNPHDGDSVRRTPDMGDEA